MRTVSHREMRNNSAEILRAVAAGETILVTNNGEPAAVLSPPEPTTLEELITGGQARAARRDIRDVLSRERPTAGVSSEDIVKDARGRW
jgi:prevent-host-death family protein